MNSIAIRFRWGLRCAALIACLAATALPASSALRVTALRGEGVNNNAASGSGTAPAVRVEDGNGAPVRDALVVFTAPESGPTVDFAGGGASAHGLTDESGVVAAPPMRPAGGNGPVEIRVTASKAGDFANIVIHQINLGIGDGPVRERELDIVALQEFTPAGDFGIRVEDGAGRPVESATIVWVLRSTDNTGKTKEIARYEGSTDAKGEVRANFSKAPRTGALDVSVKAESTGRRATRSFQLR